MPHSVQSFKTQLYRVYLIYWLTASQLGEPRTALGHRKNRHLGAMGCLIRDKLSKLRSGLNDTLARSYGMSKGFMV